MPSGGQAQREDRTPRASGWSRRSQPEARELLVVGRRAVTRDEFRLTATIGLDLDLAQQHLPFRPAVLLQDSQKLNERLDRGARCAEVAVSQSRRAMAHECLEC